MKRFFFLIFGIFSIALSAQYYEFDYMLLSEDRPLNSDFRGPLVYKRFINSKDNSYKLYIPQNIELGKEYKVSIVDWRLNVVHIFTMIPYGEARDTEFILKYEKSIGKKITKKLHSNIKVRKISDLIYDVTADIGKQTNVNIEQISLKANLIEYEDDLTNVFFFDVPGNVEMDMIAELKKNLDPKKNYFINEFVRQYFPGIAFYEKVNEVKKISYKLDLRNNKKMIKLLKKKRFLNESSRD